MTGGRQGTEVSGPGSNYGGLISGNHRAVRVTVGQWDQVNSHQISDIRYETQNIINSAIGL